MGINRKGEEWGNYCNYLSEGYWGIGLGWSLGGDER